MAEVTIVYWRDIPAQVIVGKGRRGAKRPLPERFEQAIDRCAMKIGAVLARKGVMSRLAVDFLATRREGSDEWVTHALEINLRMGGTTHPYLALQFITGGQIDAGTGLFFSPRGIPKYYRATDNLKSDSYRGLLPEDLIEILTINRLHYSHSTESGVLFHLIGALSQHGKLGMTAIANSRMEVENIYKHTLAVLDRETSIGHAAEETPPE